ncbi:hypothetical protein CC86DRAFT_400002 [Ophiobolus disseminans]|uniref:Uncharacterized protein n=1 Tax=Ophiobolus disseminans TaxID=1469910 RepID=A0A6A7AJI1_9PLEO|nr:hypothetical protein CC86DRAFT_400002 [Ophiobolus disseminans]
MSLPSHATATASAAQPASTIHPPDSPLQRIDTPTGLTLKVDFAWSKFKNTVSEKSPTGALTPLYIQHFRPLKPQLRFESLHNNQQIATSVIKNVAISADVILHNHPILLQPLKRWKTEYNYLSHTLSPDPNTPAPVTWITNVTLKTWDFICLDANQMPIAKFSANIWALTQVGNFHFDKSAAEVSTEARDEVVVMGLTLFYVMVTRMNNPLNLLGSVMAKPGKVGVEEVEMEGKKFR